MVGTLIESRGDHRLGPRRGGSLVSMVAHTALVVAVILATTTRTTVASLRPKIDVIHIIAPSNPPLHEPLAARTAALSLPTAPFVATLHVPTVISTEIPAIDFAAAVPPDNFGAARTPVVGNTCRFPCAAGDENDSSRSSVWSGNQLMMQLREKPVPPRYPESLRRAGISGDVLVRFVVDTVGNVDPESIEIITSTHDFFTAAVRESLARLRFNPAQVGIRRVPAAAVMPFHFTLR